MSSPGNRGLALGIVSSLSVGRLLNTAAPRPLIRIHSLRRRLPQPSRDRPSITHPNAPPGPAAGTARCATGWSRLAAQRATGATTTSSTARSTRPEEPRRDGTDARSIEGTATPLPARAPAHGDNIAWKAALLAGRPAGFSCTAVVRSAEPAVAVIMPLIDSAGRGVAVRVRPGDRPRPASAPRRWLRRL
jgi:hypothetical protein